MSEMAEIGQNFGGPEAVFLPTFQDSCFFHGYLARILTGEMHDCKNTRPVLRLSAVDACVMSF